MKAFLLAVCLTFAITTSATASHHRYHHQHMLHPIAQALGAGLGHMVGIGPRPSAWCGWQMRVWKGGGPELNLARNWARVGSATGPQLGAIVVWPHHVGMITGRAGNQWVVKSGNDGHAVRERARSVAGAIAFRML